MIRTLLLGLLWAGTHAAYANAQIDPTRPSLGQSVVAASVHHGLRLESVLISPVRRQAVVSGQLVQVGSVVRGATVTRIEQGGVWLQRGAGHLHLSLIGLRCKVGPEQARGGGS